MDMIFLQVLNMSLTASYVILFVLAARLLLKKTPKIFSYALWSVVLFRLTCPFSFESLFSLLFINANPIPSNIMYEEVPQIDTGINLVDSIANPILATQKAVPYASINPMQITVFLGRFIWVTGIAVMLVYSVTTLLRLRYNLIGAVKWRDNIYLADHITSPFVMGVIRPKIYLPSLLSEKEQTYIILHEQLHIRRLDHVIKIIAFLILAIHWFNPLVWLAFILCVKDMEMSCDESVMKHMDTDIRTEYSASLLKLATGRKIVAGNPLAFGEGDTKSRIKNVLSYKKPAILVIIAALVTVLAVCIGLAANPQQWSAQPEIENQDEYFKALEAARQSVSNEEIMADDKGSNEKTALAWMETWFNRYKALPKDNMAYITESAIDNLDIIKVSKEGAPKAFVFSVTFSVRPTYPIARNAFWAAGNSGESPGRDETWGQMYREVELRMGDGGRYHFADMGTGAVGHSEEYDTVIK